MRVRNSLKLVSFCVGIGIFWMYAQSFYSLQTKKLEFPKLYNKVSGFFLKHSKVLMAQEEKKQEQQQQQQNAVTSFLKQLMMIFGNFVWQFVYQLFKFPIDVAVQIFHIFTLYKFRPRNYATPGGQLVHARQLMFKVSPQTPNNKAMKMEL